MARDGAVAIGGPDGDVLAGSPFDDVLVDWAGNGEPDDYRGGAGNYLLSYKSRRDPIRLTLDGGQNEDRLASIETVIGGHARDDQRGSHAANRLEGGPGNDRLTAGAGNDHLSGNGGADWLSGGRGSDVLDLASMVGATRSAAAPVRT